MSDLGESEAQGPQGAQNSEILVSSPAQLPLPSDPGADVQSSNQGGNSSNPSSPAGQAGAGPATNGQDLGTTMDVDDAGRLFSSPGPASRRTNIANRSSVNSTLGPRSTSAPLASSTTPSGPSFTTPERRSRANTDTISVHSGAETPSVIEIKMEPITEDNVQETTPGTDLDPNAEIPASGFMGDIRDRIVKRFRIFIDSLRISQERYDKYRDTIDRFKNAVVSGVARFPFRYLVLLLLLLPIWMLAQRKSGQSYIDTDEFMSVSASSPIMSTDSPDQLSLLIATPEQQRFYFLRQLRSMQALSVETLARVGAVSDYCEVLKYAPNSLQLYVNDSSTLWQPTTDPAIRRDARALEPLAKALHEALTKGPRRNVWVDDNAAVLRDEKYEDHTPYDMVNMFGDMLYTLAVLQAQSTKELKTEFDAVGCSMTPFALRNLFTSVLNRVGQTVKRKNTALARFYTATSTELFYRANFLEGIQAMSVSPATEAAGDVLNSCDLTRLARGSFYSFGWGIPTNLLWAIRRTFFFLLGELGIANYKERAVRIARSLELDRSTRAPAPWFRDLARVAADVTRCGTAVDSLRENLLDLAKAAEESAKMVLSYQSDFWITIGHDAGKRALDGAITTEKYAALGAEARDRMPTTWTWTLADVPMLWPLLIVEPHVSYRSAGMAT